MIEMVQANWIAFALALAIGLLVAWWLFARSGDKPRTHRPDALDEGAPPAGRNQSLIDAPPAATAPPPAPLSSARIGGIGEVTAAAGGGDITESASSASISSTEPQTGDDLRKIKGVGPKLVAMLHALGVTSYAQIAAWTDEDIAAINPQLGTFAGRIRRDSWVEQCTYLAQGDAAGFEERFGKI